MKTIIVQAQQKWESLSVVRHTEATLIVAVNEVGQQGWELVSVCHFKDSKGSTAWAAFLKRPATGQSAKASQSSPSAEEASQADGPARNWDLNGESFDVQSE
jgi:hypothetical protein